MKSFKDSDGAEWILSLTIGSVKRLRDLAGVDLTKLNEGEPPLITRLATDIILVCDVLYVLCKNKADERGLSDEQFAGKLGGDAINAAWEALQEELIDFFRRLGRAELAKVIETNRQVVMKQMKVFEAKVGQLATIVEQRIETIAERIDLAGLIDSETPGTTSTSSPAQSPSTPSR